jgi:hypothetical protein
MLDRTLATADVIFVLASVDTSISPGICSPATSSPMLHWANICLFRSLCPFGILWRSLDRVLQGSLGDESKFRVLSVLDKEASYYIQQALQGVGVRVDQSIREKSEGA